MKCPECGEEMRTGFIKVQDASFNVSNQVFWYPIEQKQKKWYKPYKEYISLNLYADAYYCETCMHSVAIFKQRE